MEVIHNGRAEVTQGQGQVVRRVQEEEQTIQKALRRKEHCVWSFMSRSKLKANQRLLRGQVGERQTGVGVLSCSDTVLTRCETGGPGPNGSPGSQRKDQLGPREGRRRD